MGEERREKMIVWGDPSHGCRRGDIDISAFIRDGIALSGSDRPSVSSNLQTTAVPFLSLLHISSITLCRMQHKVGLKEVFKANLVFNTFERGINTWKRVRDRVVVRAAWILLRTVGSFRGDHVKPVLKTCI